MHYSRIDPKAMLGIADVDLGDNEPYGHLSVFLEGVAEVDGHDLLVVVDPGNPESMIVALTPKQALQALRVLARQVGRDAALTTIQNDGVIQ